MGTAGHSATGRRSRGRPVARRLGTVVLCCGLALGVLSAPASAFDGAAAREARLQALLSGLDQASIFDRLRAVNRFFNRFAYLSDRDLWGREDHWATPAELIERGAGDCEDLAIAKYFTLRRLGLAVSSLRLSYVRSATTGRSHMVLLYLRPGAGALVLDSLEDGLRPLTARADLVPVYGLNEAGITVHVPGGGERSFPHAGRWVVRHWQALLLRSRPLPAARTTRPVAQTVPAPVLVAAAPRFHD